MVNALLNTDWWLDMKFSKLKRQAVAEKCNWHCAYCGMKLSQETFVIDHVVAKSDNGTNNIDNLLPACRSCNSTKGVKTLEQFRLFTSFRKAIPSPEFNQTQIEFLQRKGVLNELGNFKEVKFFFEGEF